MQLPGLRESNVNGRRICYESGGREETRFYSRGNQARFEAAFTLLEVMVGCVILGMMTTALCGCIWSGFSLVQSSRENLRANQILVQRTEAIRLFNWDQLLDTNYLKPTFIEYYDPQAANTSDMGVAYYGTVTPSISSNLPVAYRDNMRVITLTLNWTNVTGRSVTARSRQWQTQVARLGIQNYVYG